MKRFRFDQAVGRNIGAFNSQNLLMSRILQAAQPVHIGCMYIGRDGCVGFHQASSPQLFLVVQGEGWIAGENHEHVLIQAGQAVYWDAGEWHESGSQHGMTAFVIEGSELDPEKTMSPLI